MPYQEDQPVDRCIAARPILRAVFGPAVLAATIMLALVPGAAAQSRSEPNLQTKIVPPTAAAKALPNARAKSCSIYGDGFVYAPTTDTCIKIGGYVTIEGGRR